jgi:2-dehydro-3-deoxyphosphogluconate aldolase/(4S)-4-hydroxy-2-oxoglutarate aldolase
MSLAQIHQQVIAQRVMAIIRTGSQEQADAAARAAIEAGVRSIEVTFTTPGALAVIADLVRDYPDAVVGAGTVLDVAAAQSAVAAGARFLVSPHLDTELVGWAIAHDLPAYPGTATLTEIVTAVRAGAPAVKLFPASAYGPDFVRAVHGPLPDVQVMPTGGVTVATAADWIAAGAVAVGVGSELTRGDASEVAGRVRALLRAVGADA